jgi:hypothetical protein
VTIPGMPLGGVRPPPSSGLATPGLRIHHTSRPTHRTGGLVGVDLSVTLDPLRPGG